MRGMATFRSTTAAASTAPVVASSFHVGAHVIRVTKIMEGRWTFAIDEQASSGSYATQAEAWEAGVRDADRLDRGAA